MRLQEVRIHGNTPLNNAFNYARPIRLIYGLRKDLVELWIKETATILTVVTFGRFTLSVCSEAMSLAFEIVVNDWLPRSTREPIDPEYSRATVQIWQTNENHGNA
jgi:hypothetical protein